MEHRFGHPLDPLHPGDLAIAYALRLEAEFRDDAGVDHRERIFDAAAAEGVDGAASRQLAIEEENREGEIESAAFEIMTALHGRSPIGAGPRRRWREDLGPLEQQERKRLEEARHNSGLTAEDRVRYEQLTEPSPVEEIDWSQLPAGLYEQAEALVELRRRWAVGKGERRVSRTDRRRLPLFIRPPLSHQLGVIMTSDDPFVLERAVRDLRRNAKRLGFHEPDYDRRRKHSS